MSKLEKLKKDWKEVRDALKIAKESIEHAEGLLRRIPKDVVEVLES